MSNLGHPLLSVRAEARQLVPPDYAVLTGTIEHTEGSKAGALQAAAASLDRLTAELSARGGVPFDQSAGRSELTWSAHSAATYEERYHDKETGHVRMTGQVTATVALYITVRALGTLDALSELLAAQPNLMVHHVSWHVDWDNPAWPDVRASAIQAAVRKAGDYAAALGGTLGQVEHIADVGLLGTGETAAYPPATARAPARALKSAAAGMPEAPSLDPVPQELIATIEARFRAAGVSRDTLYRIMHADD